MFAVQQRTPTTVDEAVTAVLELETFLRLRTVPETDTVVARVAGQKQAAERKDLLQMILERLYQLERQLEGSGSESKNTEMSVEFNCSRRNAIAETAQECTMRSEPEQQGTRQTPYISEPGY